ncbi:hypothetical protein AQPE_0365 [Aquipluma nitroreducens]|uniref:Uncharacterized protein n=1 Tax=Aquipluma nitroreducens TaxID=2010828 RepID=A0A5K7S3S6_9BACT|nr:hypothetical protein [Aquipluma nitroreducens]BBE16228.1 hypothetical protein AQPE_0365 [Aquipluma nitroreducens]
MRKKSSIGNSMNYIFFLLRNEDLNFLSQISGTKNYNYPIIRGIIVFFGGFIKSLKDMRLKINHPNKYTIFLYWNSINNKSVIDPISNIIDNSGTISFKNKADIKLFGFGAYFISLLYFPIVLYQYFNEKNSGLRNVYKYRFAYVWRSFGLYIYLRSFFSSCKNKVLVIPNDHEFKARIIRLAAFEKKVPTVYIQHASISPYFPPLDFEYAFLDGEDALEKYSKIGNSDTIVFLTGNAKYDDWFSVINRSTIITNLGICPGIIDGVAEVQTLIIFIKSKFPNIKLFLRPHPSDKRIEIWKTITGDLNVEMNDSVHCSSFDFLKSTDAIIACESNIHLEAAILNVIPIYYNFQETVIYNDVYGFLKKRLVYDCQKSFELINILLDEILNSKPDVSHKIKPYIDTASTKYQGCSASLMAKLVVEIQNKKIDFSIWEKCREYHNIRAYKLRIEV